jgi:alpha-glucosidase
VLYFRNGELRVLTNFGADPAELPAGAELVHASGPLDSDGRVPTDVTVWLRVAEEHA